MSTDSLKKKVCVTVFLDELFEEVVEEDWNNLKQVSEVTESEVKIAEKPFKGPPRIGLGNDEKVNVSPNADTERNELQLRPRKHRRESKFSKNHCDSFKNELTEFEHGSNFKRDDECCEPLESPFSDSDFDVDDFVEGDNWTYGNSKSSFSELSEGNLSEECCLSIKPVPSSYILWPQKNEEPCEEMVHAAVRSGITRNKCTGSVESHSKGDVKKEQKEDDVYYEKVGRNTGRDILAWKKTQREIQLVLANARSRQLERETSKAEFVQQPYDLKSILEACVKAKENTPAKEISFNAGDECAKNLNEDSNSFQYDSPYTCVFPDVNLRNKARPSEVNKVCFKRNLWNDCLESDLSEGDNSKGIGPPSMPNESVLCYTLCLRCKKSVYQQTGRGESGTFDTNQSSTYSTSRESSIDSLKSRASQNADFLLRTVTQLANQTIFGTMLKNEQQRREEEAKNEGNLLAEMRRSTPAIESLNTSLAEGDTFHSPLNQDQKLIIDFDDKERLKEILCDEILGHVEEPQAVNNKILVNCAQIRVNPQNGDTPKAEGELLNSSSRPSSLEGIAEFLFKQQRSLEKNMTEAESEMVFAESENSYDYEDIFEGSTPSVVLGTPRNDICVVEFEDKLSRSKILRRMKTVEILGDNSLNDMSTRISTEVFLICENISSNEVCLEAWHSSASTLRSFTELGQCYLKDNKDSAMYLIEIPLHFIRNKRQPSKSDQASDSDSL